MNSPIFIVVNMLINFALIVLFLRFMMQWAQIDAKHPYMMSIKRLTGVVDVFASIFPTLAKGRFSVSALVLMLLLYWINLAANAFILHQAIDALTLFFAGTLRAIVRCLSLLRYVIFGSILASWAVMLFNVKHPAAEILMQLAEPILAPFRRIIPNLGMLDLSPIAALFGLILLQEFVQIIGANILLKM